MIGDTKVFNGVKGKEVSDNGEYGCHLCVFYKPDNSPRCEITDEADESCIDNKSHYVRVSE